MNHKIVLAISVAIATVCGTSHASIVTFFDKPTFLALTGASDATGPLPNLGYIGSGSQTVGSITFSPGGSSILYIGTLNTGYGPTWTPLLPDNSISTAWKEDLNIVTSNPVFSLGFDFAEPSIGGGGYGTCYVSSCIDSTFTVTLMNGGSTVDTFNYNAPNDVAAFVGVLSNQPFNRVEIREIIGSNEDEFFGRVYTGTTPVPAPAAFWLFLSGLAALVRNFRGVSESFGITSCSSGE